MSKKHLLTINHLVKKLISEMSYDKYINYKNLIEKKNTLYINIKKNELNSELLTNVKDDILPIK